MYEGGQSQPPLQQLPVTNGQIFFFQLHKLAATLGCAAVWCRGIVHAQKQMEFEYDYVAPSIAVQL